MRAFAKLIRRFFVVFLMTMFLSTGNVHSADIEARNELDFQPSEITAFQYLGMTPEMKGERDTCSMPFPGSGGYRINDWLTGDETFYVYQDPTASDCSSPIPFAVIGLQFSLCLDITCSTSIYFEVYDAVGSVCPVPGDLLFATTAGPLMASGGSGCTTWGVSFADSQCVDGPFFISYTLPDSVDCFDLFTDTLPGNCISYVFANDSLYDLGQLGFPGQIWMVANGLDSAQSGCSVSSDSIYSIPEIFENIDSLDGQQVRVFGEYVSPDDSKLLTIYGRYMFKELMPPSSIMFLDGTFPDSAYWHGGTMIVTGTLSTAPNPSPIYPQDSFLITVTASAYEYIDIGFDTTSPPFSSEPDISDVQDQQIKDEDCDPCKFAILVGGSTDPAQNNDGFWEDIENMYEHKTKDTASGGEGYCPENIEIIYNNGNSGDPAAIPDSAVDSLSMENLQAAHDSVAAGVAECHRQGKPATVQKLFSGHGKNDSGLVIGPDDYLSPEELKEMEQKVIDSCAEYLYDEFLECYGGDMVDSMKALDDKEKTEIHSNSEAGSNTPAVGSASKGSAFMRKKIERLEAGDDYETAVDSARAWYIYALERILQKYQEKIDSLNNAAGSMPSGSTQRNRTEDVRDEYEELKNRIAQAKAEAAPSFVRHQFKKYCEWKKVTCPPGGQLTFEFKGSGGCGNIKIYRQNADGTKTRVKTWNWNLPGSPNYEPGNETRYYSVPLNDPGTYLIHNDNGKFTLTSSTTITQQNPSSNSNRQDFAGGSNGGSDGSSSEFGYYMAPYHQSLNTFSDGFNLEEVPQVLGAMGVITYAAHFNIPEYNVWWSDMAVWINVLEVFEPGLLAIECAHAESLFVLVDIFEPGEYMIPIGGFFPEAVDAELIFNTTVKQGLNFTWDSWGLRTLVPTTPEHICGDTDGDGLINIFDITFVIAYLYMYGPAPDPMEMADVNNDGTVNIFDITYLISHLYMGGPPPDCP